MRKIAAIALLYAISAAPAFASDDYAYSEPGAPDALGYVTPSEIMANISEIRIKADRLSTFSLVELNDNFSLYGKLSVPRLTSGNETMMQHGAVTYGLHGQVGSLPGMGIPKVGIRFGWNRHLTGQDTGGNLYSLTAEIKF